MRNRLIPYFGSWLIAIVVATIALVDIVLVDVVQADDGLTTVEGKYLRLVTNLPKSEELQGLVRAFDNAVPLWLEYWNRDLASINGWRMTGYLMQEKADFQRLHVVPNSVPDFLNGYQAGDKLWVIHQPSEFYTLHLLLHEGVHGIAEKLFGGAGPPWYMEGTAEFLATHVRGDLDLQIGVIPASRESSPYWGRIGLISERRVEGKIPTIEAVMKYGDTAHREVEPYAWSWAAALLMEMYPEYRERFRAAALGGGDSSPQFTKQFYQSMEDEWPIVAARWQLLCQDLDYGFDRERNRVALDLSLPTFSATTMTMKLATNQGWQSAPAFVHVGQRIEIEADGQYQLREDAKWKSGAEGVTITYCRGIPLGRVIACVVPVLANSDRYLPTLEVASVGAKTTFVVPNDGWLLLKVNDSPSDLADNQGELDVRLSLHE